jgi:hypothetical protein
VTERGQDLSDPGLDGLFDRIPAVTPPSLQRRNGLTELRERWRARHTVALIALVPALFAAFWAADGSGGLPAVPLVGAMAVAAALILVTYVPTPDVKVLDSSCALVTALFVPLAGFLLHQSGSFLGAASALALLVLGLWQRVAGYSACNQ